MKDFQLHDIETAPEDSQPLLKGSIKAFGMIPNLHAVMEMMEMSGDGNVRGQPLIFAL